MFSIKDMLFVGKGDGHVFSGRFFGQLLDRTFCLDMDLLSKLVHSGPDPSIMQKHD